MIFRVRETLRVFNAYENSSRPYILTPDTDIHINFLNPRFNNSKQRLYVTDRKNHKTNRGAIGIPAGLLDVYSAETLEESQELMNFSNKVMTKPLLFIPPELGKSVTDWLEQEAFFFLAGETLEYYKEIEGKKHIENIGKRNLLATFVESQCKEKGVTYYRLNYNSGLFQIEEVSASGVSVSLEAFSLENAIQLFSSSFS